MNEKTEVKYEMYGLASGIIASIVFLTMLNYIPFHLGVFYPVIFWVGGFELGKHMYIYKVNTKREKYQQ